MRKFSLHAGGRVPKSSIAMLMTTSLFLFGNSAGASSSNVTGSVNVSSDSIGCGKPTTVTMQLTGQAGITQNPVDVMLVLDKSGSMSNSDMNSLKTAANQFVDIIDRDSDGVKDGVIGNGSRVGVVSFADNAVLDHSLSPNAGSLKNRINGIVKGNLTNHTAAFQLAQAQLSASNPSSKKIMIMFTDGQSTAGGNPATVAANARAAGTEIYAIGLGIGLNITPLNNWATDPDHKHVFSAPNSSQLENIFKGIGAAIVTPAATNISIRDQVNSQFSVSDVSATKGTPTLSGNEISWTISSLESETAELTYTITHNGDTDGPIQVNDVIAYTDDEGQNTAIQSAVVNVTGCDTEPPVTEALLSAENAYEEDGWYKKDVIVPLHATDDKSGVDRTEYAVTFNGASDGAWERYSGNPLSFTKEGSYTIKYRSIDKAGNVEEEKTVSFTIDKTAPVLDVVLDKTVLWSPNHKMVTVNAAVTNNDLLSGISSVQLDSITSSEADDGYNKGDQGNDIQHAVYQSLDTSFDLRAERFTKNGRVYTITYKAIDKAGNETTTIAKVSVPHNK